MRTDGFTHHLASETIGGATHGLRYVPSSFYDRWLGKPHPAVFQREHGYALAHRCADNQDVHASIWHRDRAPVAAAARRLSARCDRRVRRGRVAKKIAQRGGRRRFGTPPYVRRLNLHASG